MIRLTQNNSMSQILGLSPDQFDGLREELSSEEISYGYLLITHKTVHRCSVSSRGVVMFRDYKGIQRPVLNRIYRPFRSIQDTRDAISRRERAFIKGNIVKRTSLMSRNGQFPSGLVKRALKWLRDHGVPYTLDDARVPPVGVPGTFTLTDGLTPYPEQLECAKVAGTLGRGAIVMPTGSGKSIAIVLLLARLQLRSLVIVPNLSLKAQMTETFLKHFGTLANVTVENIDSPKLSSLTDFDVIVIDEAHHAAAQTYQRLNKNAWKSIYHRFYFTATPYRSKDAEAIVLEGIIGDVIYRLSYGDAVKNGRIVAPEAFYYLIPRQRGGNGGGSSWRSVYTNLVVENEHRNQLISSIVKTLQTSGRSTLVLVREIKHGDTLARLTNAPFANGESPDCQRLIQDFSDGKIETLIATTGVCGEGVDTRAAEWIIVAGGGKSRNAFVQQCGRGFRRFGDKASCKIILFKDQSHHWLLDHFKCQIQFLREEFGVEATEESFSDPTL